MVYNGVSNRLLGTDDLTKLSNNEIKSLDIGDTVILNANGEEKAFRVAKKSASEFSMIHTGKDKVVEVKYVSAEVKYQRWLDSHFNDSENKITLTKDELENFAFNNLFSYFDTLFSSSKNVSVGSVFINGFDNKNFYLSKTHPYAVSLLDNVIGAQIYLYFNNTTYADPYKFSIFSNETMSTLDFTTDFVWSVSPTFYVGVKNAIELDLKANNPFVASGWEYDSTTETAVGGTTEEQVEEIAKGVVEGAESGTIANVLGLDSEGGLVKGTVSNEKKTISISISYSDLSITSGKPVIITQSIIDKINAFMELVRNDNVEDMEVLIQYPVIQSYETIFPRKLRSSLIYKYEDHANAENPYTCEYLYTIYEGDTLAQESLALTMVGFYLDSNNTTALVALGEKLTSQAQTALFTALASNPFVINIIYKEKPHE